MRVLHFYQAILVYIKYFGQFGIEIIAVVVPIKYCEQAKRNTDVFGHQKVFFTVIQHLPRKRGRKEGIGVKR